VNSTFEKSVPMAGEEPGQPQIGVPSLSLKKQLILCGVGWGALPDHMINSELKSKPLVSLGHKVVEVPFQLAWKKKKNLGPCAQFLISTLEAKIMDLS
jgi:DNA-binding transcriptional LysR family regulator